MTSLGSLVRRNDTGSPSPIGRRIAVVLAVLTPLLIAGVAVSALQAPAASDSASPASAGDSPAAGPLLPAAVVNNDAAVTVKGADGTDTPVLIGKLLTTDLADGTSGHGFSWTVTDADTASAGLASGAFSAVVTIPSDFTASYLSVSSADPVQATLQVQTNAATGYATELLATALSTDLQSAVADQSTNGFVTKTLGAFTTLNTDLGKAADASTQISGFLGQSVDGTNTLANGLTTLADEGGAPVTTVAQALSGGLDAVVVATADLPVYADGLAVGSRGITDGIGLLKTRLADETAKSYDIDQRQKDLEAGIATLRADVPTLSTDQVQQRLDALQLEAAGIRVSSFTVTLGLGVDALGVSALESVSGALSGAQAEFAADIPALTSGLSDAAKGAAVVAEGTAGITTGIRQAARGASELAGGLQKIQSAQSAVAGGLSQAVTSIPTYTDDQQTQLATVVTTPIVTQQSTTSALPSPAAAIAAVAVPLALWIGAFAVYLLLAPFTRAAIVSTASTAAVVLRSLRPAVVLAVAQAAVVAVVLFAVGAQPAHLAASILFSLLASVAFVTLHQGLVALFGQAGRLLSVALVVVQLAAAAVIIPNGISSPVYSGLATVLPLAQAVTGLQALIAGGSLSTAVQAGAVLVVFALIGLALSLVAVSRQRGRDAIPA
ncbi:YhgE/Pip domain-containing protein [Herbiconiux sp. P18]|uniref:YhgE/Pip domain-containing protein n=1 Tax=Herbiconiux liangxiaofengii TaxID=3342795 RepID=UPI0035BA63A1